MALAKKTHAARYVFVVSICGGAKYVQKLLLSRIVCFFVFKAACLEVSSDCFIYNIILAHYGEKTARYGAQKIYSETYCAVDTEVLAYYVDLSRKPPGNIFYSGRGHRHRS